MYSQDYLRPSYASTAGDATVLGRVFGLLGMSFAFTAVGAVVGTRLGADGYLLGLIVSLVMIIALRFLKDRSPLNLILLYTFAVADGVLLGGILEEYVQAGLGGAVVDAAATTAAVTIGAGFFGVTTKRDLSGLGGFLSVALLALIVALIVGLFVHMAAFQLVVAVIGALLFTGFILVDTQRVARSGTASEGDAIMMAVSVYLDIVNLFLFLLQIFGLGSRGRD